MYDRMTQVFVHAGSIQSGRSPTTAEGGYFQGSAVSDVCSNHNFYARIATNGLLIDVLSDLKGEYDALVGTGALTEVEFWAPRAALLSSHASAAVAGVMQSSQPANPNPAGRVLGISNMMLDMNVGIIYLYMIIGLMYSTHIRLLVYNTHWYNIIGNWFDVT